MGADRWQECPNCKRETEAYRKGLQQAAKAAYGKVSAERYAELTAQGQAEIEQHEQFLEDWELGMCEDGKFFVSYNGWCQVCGFGTDFKHEFIVDRIKNSLRRLAIGPNPITVRMTNPVFLLRKSPLKPESEQPTRGVILASLIELVVDGEEMAYVANHIHNEPNWRDRWQTETPDWFAMVVRGRSILEACGMTVPTPEYIREQRRDKRRHPLRSCDNCGRKRGHLVTCPNHRTYKRK